MYKRNFIDEVILRVDFNQPLQDLTTEKLKEFQLQFKIESEIKEDIIQQFEFKLEKSKDPNVNFKTIGRRGTFSLEGGINKLILENIALSLSTSKYKEFKSFEEIFLQGFEIFNEIFGISEYKRIGLRFINRIKLDELQIFENLSEYINQEYFINYNNITPTEPLFEKITLRRNINNLILSDGEYIIQVNMGVWNNNFPGKIVENELIIDLDCYVQNLILEKEEVIKRLPKMSDLNTSYFNFLITDKLKTFMSKNDE